MLISGLLNTYKKASRSATFHGSTSSCHWPCTSATLCYLPDFSIKPTSVPGQASTRLVLTFRVTTPVTPKLSPINEFSGLSPNCKDLCDGFSEGFYLFNMLVILRYHKLDSKKSLCFKTEKLILIMTTVNNYSQLIITVIQFMCFFLF